MKNRKNWSDIISFLYCIYLIPTIKRVYLIKSQYLSVNQLKPSIQITKNFGNIISWKDFIKWIKLLVMVNEAHKMCAWKLGLLWNLLRNFLIYRIQTMNSLACVLYRQLQTLAVHTYIHTYKHTHIYENVDKLYALLYTLQKTIFRDGRLSVCYHLVVLFVSCHLFLIATINIKQRSNFIIFR